MRLSPVAFTSNLSPPRLQAGVQTISLYDLDPGVRRDERVWGEAGGVAW
jgi:hypothetical protein